MSSWLTRVCQEAWCSGKPPRDLHTGMIISIQKKGYRSECINCEGIVFIGFFGKVYAKCLEKRCHEIIEPKLQDTQNGFRPGRTVKNTFCLSSKFFEKSSRLQENARPRSSWKTLESVAGVWCWRLPSSHCIPAKTFVFVSAEFNHKRLPCLVSRWRSWSILGCISWVTEGRTRRLIHRLVKQTQFCMNFIALCW